MILLIVLSKGDVSFCVFTKLLSRIFVVCYLSALGSSKASCEGFLRNTFSLFFLLTLVSLGFGTYAKSTCISLDLIWAW